MALIVLGAVIAVVVLLIVVGRSRWEAGTRERRGRLEAGRVKVAVGRYDPAEILGLPTPVRRYFEAALRPGQAMVGAVSLEQVGTFNMGEKEAQWKPFHSTQRNVMARAGFDWDARIEMMPGFPVFVHDSYVGGRGWLRASVLGLVTMAEVEGGKEVNEGELMRFLAETPWYPTRLLPSQGVSWVEVDEHRARATLVDGETRCELTFQFGVDGLIERLRAEARYRTLGDKLVAAPWEGRFWNYASREGMMVPLEGEVIWMLRDGPWPYWRGRVTRFGYEFIDLGRPA